ncbi:MBOAT family O-acyltransferase, partial [Helicobacter sp. 23-1045]
DSSLRVSEANAAIHNLNSTIDCHDSATFNKVAESRNDTINYEYLAKGIFIFSIGLFKKVFIADSFAKWANAGFGIVENGGVLNIAESWATSLSYTFQLYFDFSGYCDMAMGLALMFGIVLPLNFNSPYKSLNIAEFWRRWHITLGRFLKECLYIPLGGNRGKGNSSLTRPSRELEKFSFDRPQVLSQSNFSAQPTNLAQDTRIANDLKNKMATKILTLRNLFIVAFLSGIWHGAGWGFVIWGVLHGVAMVIHRIYAWF